MKITVKWLILPAAAAILAVGFAQSPSAAEKIYLDKCASCHSKDGSGTTAKGKKLELKDLRSTDVQKATDAKWLELIAKGKGDMDGYQKELKAEEIKALVAYMRTFAKPAK
jgi:mono/diheme cytochrome c family protein